MIDALIHGRIVHCQRGGNLLIGRIVSDNDETVQFTARRGRIKSTLQALATGTPLSVAGSLTTRVRLDKAGTPFVEHSIHVSAVLTAQPKGLFGRFF